MSAKEEVSSCTRLPCFPRPSAWHRVLMRFVSHSANGNYRAGNTRWYQCCSKHPRSEWRLNIFWKFQLKCYSNAALDPGCWKRFGCSTRKIEFASITHSCIFGSNCCSATSRRHVSFGERKASKSCWVAGNLPFKAQSSKSKLIAFMQRI